MAEEIKFNSPEEEVEMLKKIIQERPDVAKEILRQHLEKKPEEILKEEHRLKPEEIQRESEKIFQIKEQEGGDSDQRQIVQLLQLAQDKGVYNAISVVKKINDPYLEDAFHDALINFLQGLNNK